MADGAADSAHNTDNTTDIRIGTCITTKDSPRPVIGVYDDPKAARAAWSWVQPNLRTTLELKDAAAARVEKEVVPALAQLPQAILRAKPDSAGQDIVSVPPPVLKRHALIFGSTGMGKSTLAFHLIKSQLKSRCSLVAFDRDVSTLRRLRGACEKAGMSPGRVALISTAEPESTPALNPFLALPPAEAVALLKDILVPPGDANVIRMKRFLRNALVIAAWHGLCLDELPLLLASNRFRDSVFTRQPLHPVESQYQRSVQFFRAEYPEINAGDRAKSAEALDNRLDELLGTPPFQRMLNVRKNTADFVSLFEQPGAILVSLGRAGGLSDDARHLLATMIGSLLEAASDSPRNKGKVPVVFSVDEAGYVARSLERLLGEAADTSRKRNLRLIVSTTHPGALPETVRESFTQNTAFKAYFKMEGDGGDKVAARLAAREDDVDGDEARAPRLRIVPVSEPKKLYWCPVRAVQAGGGPDPVPVRSLAPPPEYPMALDTSDPKPDLRRVRRFNHLITGPLLIRDGRKISDVVRDLPAGSAHLYWEGEQLQFSVTLPLLGVERIPAPAQRPYEKWRRALLKLEERQAVVVVDTGDPLTIAVDAIYAPDDASADYVQKARESIAAPPYTPRYEVVAAPDTTHEPVSPRQKAYQDSFVGNEDV